MSYCLCHFPSGLGEKIWDKFYVLEFAAKLLGSPPRWFIGSTILIPIDPLFQLQNSFLTL
jgi:hypothetical protein